MNRTRSTAPFTARHKGFAIVGACLVPVTMVAALSPDNLDAIRAHQVLPLIAGALLLVVCLLSYVRWWLEPQPGRGWVIAALTALTIQSVGGGAIRLSPEAGRHDDDGWPLMVAVVTVVATAVLATLSRRTQPPRQIDPLALGGAIGGAAIVGRLLLMRADEPMPLPGHLALSVALLVAYTVVIVLLSSNPHCARRQVWLLGLSIGLIGALQFVRMSPVNSDGAEFAIGAALAGVAIMATTLKITLLQESLDRQRAHASALEGTLLHVESQAMTARERLHEVQATLAGVVSASHLLDDSAVNEGARARLELSIRSEIDRLDRLLSGKPDQSTHVDLDRALESVLELHRVRGRSVVWEPSGVYVIGNSDDVAESVNILVENAAVHGQGAMRVDIEPAHDDGVAVISVSNRGPRVPEHLRTTIFEWGKGRADSPGQGIGLNLARRLVAAQGGTLTLEDAEEGTCFAIRLPLAAQGAGHAVSQSLPMSSRGDA